MHGKHEHVALSKYILLRSIFGPDRRQGLQGLASRYPHARSDQLPSHGWTGRQAKRGFKGDFSSGQLRIAWPEMIAYCYCELTERAKSVEKEKRAETGPRVGSFQAAIAC